MELKWRVVSEILEKSKELNEFRESCTACRVVRSSYESGNSIKAEELIYCTLSKGHDGPHCSTCMPIKIIWGDEHSIVNFEPINEEGI